ncbi:MAG: hypothetical protein IJX55_05590 [Clostridia bacterium]|nr:hypothetical protein [Clostridia bacterium]
MFKFRKIVYIILCLCFVIGCAASCGSGNVPAETTASGAAADPDVLKSKRDITKIVMGYYSDNVHIMQSEEEFHEYLDTYIAEEKSYGCGGVYFDIIFDKENAVTLEELSGIEYIFLRKNTIENTSGYGEEIHLQVAFEDVDIEAIMNLTANEKIKGIRFAHFIEHDAGVLDE